MSHVCKIHLCLAFHIVQLFCRCICFEYVLGPNVNSTAWHVQNNGGSQPHVDIGETVLGRLQMLFQIGVIGDVLDSNPIVASLTTIGLENWLQPVWPDLVKLNNFGENSKVFGQFLTDYFCAKMLNLLWSIIFAIVQIFVTYLLSKAKYRTDSQAIWSHWLHTFRTVAELEQLRWSLKTTH